MSNAKTRAVKKKHRKHRERMKRKMRELRANKKDGGAAGSGTPAAASTES